MELFKAKPSDDIPRNKLTEKLGRGLQHYVQRMQKRESFYAELIETPKQDWMPAPREYSTISFCNQRSYLIGGQNFDTIKDVAELNMPPSSVDNETLPEWRNVGYCSANSVERIFGRCRHTSCVYNDKIYCFGGSYMYNRKRQVRECNAQVMVFDSVLKTLNVMKTKGISVQPRKDHSCAIYGKSFILSDSIIFL